jgi:excisionase family DNA binding protein
VDNYDRNQLATVPTTHSKWHKDRLLKISAAAQRLQVSRTTMHTLIRRGEVRTVHQGHSVRVPSRELDALISRINGTCGPLKITIHRLTGPDQQEAGTLD